MKKNEVGAGKKLTCLGSEILKIGRRGAKLQRYKVLEKSGDDSYLISKTKLQCQSILVLEKSGDDSDFIQAVSTFWG